MKRISKFTKKLSAMLAAVMVLTLCLSMSVFAAETVTIKAPAGTDPTGMTVSAYQVLNQTNVGAASGQETYEVTTDFANFFAGAEANYEENLASAETIYLGYSDNALTVSNTAGSGTIEVALEGTALDKDYFAADLLSRLDASEIRTMSDWLTQYINANRLTASQTTSTWSGNKETGMTAELPDLAEGYYAIVATKVPDGIALEQSILNTAVTDTISLKADTIPVTKTVENAYDTNDTAAETAKAAVGDTLNYTVTTRTPDLTNYSADGTYTFTISDTLTNQKLNENSFELTIDGTEVNLIDVTEVDGINYGTYENGSQTFTIAFDVAKLKASGYSDKEVVLIYSAELMAEAESVNGNNVTLTYSNDPYSDSTSTPGDTTKVYTYGLDIQKDFSDGSNNYSAVTFQLHKENAAGEIVNFEGTDGSYTKADSASKPLVPNLKLSGTGSLSLSGLDEGTYYLVETAAPADFNKVTVKIVIAADANDPSTLDQTGSNATYNGSSAETKFPAGDRISMSFNVLNQKGFRLPTTGGAGTWMFTIGGIVLIAAAGGVFFALRRKSGK